MTLPLGTPLSTPTSSVELAFLFYLKTIRLQQLQHYTCLRRGWIRGSYRAAPSGARPRDERVVGPHARQRKKRPQISAQDSYDDSVFTEAFLETISETQ